MPSSLLWATCLRHFSSNKCDLQSSMLFMLNKCEWAIRWSVTKKIGFRSLIIRCWPANNLCFEVLRITFYFRSFVPPVRDEESETQRKAHAKRVRETRRSTQGVTLEDLKSAEQLVKKKQQQENQQRTSELQQLVASQNKNSPTTVPSVSIQQPSSGKHISGPLQNISKSHERRKNRESLFTF